MSDNESSSSADSSSSSSSSDDFIVAKSTKPATSTSPNEPSDDEEGNTLQINSTYAREYTSRKRREELVNHRQLREREGIESDDDDDSSSDESEDEDGELLTADMDVKIIKTLRALKSKDEGIYDQNVTFFDADDENDDEEEVEKEDKVKKMRYKDVVREHILEEMEADESGTQLKDDLPKRGNERGLAYDKEQQDIRRAFLESTRDGDGDDNSDEDEDNWLKPKAKSNQSNQDQAQLQKLWEEEFATQEEEETSSSKLIDPKGEVQDPDKFLLDFMTHRKWVDTTDAALRNRNNSNDDDSSIESFQNKMDDFESKYNFRFEEAAARESGGIVHYARGSAGDKDVLRRKEDTRRQKREARKQRKAEERKAKEEQLRRLKNAKKEELEERMAQVRNVLGYDPQEGKEAVLGAAEEEMILKLMEGEYDPEKFEQVMNAAYGEDYYKAEDEKWKNDLDVKTDLAEEDGELVGGGDLYDDEEEVEEIGEEAEAYPADDANQEDEMYDEEEARWEEEQYNNESGMEKKLKSKMLDELYKLDYEDIIGDMPTRFKYRSVEPNSYGLSTTEILMANDTSLKQFVSLKKMAPYRDEGEYQPGTKKRKRFRQMLKSDREEMEKAQQHHVEVNNYELSNNQDEVETKKKKRRRQKKGKKSSVEVNSSTDRGDNEVQSKAVHDNTVAETDKKRRRRKNKIESTVDLDIVTATDDSINSTKEELKVKKTQKKDKTKHSHKDGMKKKRKKMSGVEGVSAARLASYGI